MYKGFFTFLGVLFLSLAPLYSADVVHNLGSPHSSAHVDDCGGCVDNGGDNLSYYINFNFVDQSAFGTLALYADRAGVVTVDNGMDDTEASDFINGSGLSLFDLSVIPGASAAGQVALASIAPLTPVSFLASQSGLQVEQVSYSPLGLGNSFLILEYRVTNLGDQAQAVKLGLINDFDVDIKTADWQTGFDEASQSVWQMEGPPLDPNYTSIAVSLLRGSEVIYRLEVCDGLFCAILQEDPIRQAFFEEVPGEVGDLTAGLLYQDYAVSIAGDLGVLEPGDSETIAFCYQAASDVDEASSFNGLLDQNQLCDDFYSNEIANCSNGLINYGEACDDGNQDNNDSCTDDQANGGSCQDARCGDGFVWNSDGGSEACDDGNDSINDSCPDGPTGSCQNANCGDGFVWNSDGGSENCDDGNGGINDSCPDGPAGTCQSASCGDGFVWNSDGGNENCDDGNHNPNDNCPDGAGGSCQDARCGDGFVWNQDLGTETCDDGNDNTQDHCPSGPSGTCLIATCGDGFVNLSGEEVCDDGNNVSGDGCSADCRSFESCGNGQLDLGETCDDGNGHQNDACPDGPSGTCRLASCGDGFLQEGVEACDDGNNLPGDGCSPSCNIEGPDPSSSPQATCGNGVQEAGETCDDGNGNNNDSCPDGDGATCQLATCGDGFVWNTDGGTEICDGEDFCTSFCEFPLVLQGGGASDDPDLTFFSGCSLQKGPAPAKANFLILALSLGLGLSYYHRQKLQA